MTCRAHMALVAGGLFLALLAAWLLEPGVASTGLACRRLGAAIILGCGALAPLLARQPSLRSLLAEVTGLILGAGGLLILAQTSGLELPATWLGVSVVAGTWFFCWCCVLPLRVGGAELTAPLIFLALAAGLLSTPFFLDPAAGSLPDWALSCNPLVRLQAQIGGADWLRGPLLYPLAGSRYFRYPSDWNGLWPLGGIAMGCLGVALGGLRARPSPSRSAPHPVS